MITFGADEDHCPDCQQRLKVLKTKQRDAVTLHIGMFHAQETISICDRCRRTYGSDDLRRLVEPSCNFGYDVLVYVGRALFVGHRRSQEICDELAAQNVRISPREADCLGKKFIVYLAMAHRQAAPSIKQAMRSNGGYILHLDATCDGNEPLLMSGLDSITQIVLGNVKLPSEKADTIIPFLEQIKQSFGDPVASVHDMGAGIIKAVTEVFANMPDFICHVQSFGNPLDRMNLSRRFKQAIKVLGADCYSSIHDGRHSFASIALAAGRTLPEVRDALGHRNISTTSVYLHALDDGTVGSIFE